MTCRNQCHVPPNARNPIGAAAWQEFGKHGNNDCPKLQAVFQQGQIYSHPPKSTAILHGFLGF